MNILAVDTATANCSIGLTVDGVHYWRNACEQRDHARVLLPEIERLLGEANLESSALNLLVWNAGPGSFTGLRIAASVVQALAYAHTIPVLSCSSLALLAHAAQLQADEQAVCVLDARMGSVYLGHYRQCGSLPEAVSEDCLLSVAEASAWLAERQHDRIIGADAVLLGVKGEAVASNAEDLLALAQYMPSSLWQQAGDCAPCYLRDATQWQKRARIRSIC